MELELLLTGFDDVDVLVRRTAQVRGDAGRAVALLVLAAWGYFLRHSSQVVCFLAVSVVIASSSIDRRYLKKTETRVPVC